MNATTQLSLLSSSIVKENKSENKNWLGLAIDHRQLFTFFQDEWINVTKIDDSIILGVNRYTKFPTSEEDYENKILVYIQFSTNLLPNIKINTVRKNLKTIKLLKDICSSDEEISWQETLPFFSIKNIFVSNEEELSRITNLSRLVSNISLPPIEVSKNLNYQKSNLSLDVNSFSIGVTDETKIDSIRGAMAMAMYTVPRIAPWLDILVNSFTSNDQKLGDYVNSPWWNNAPWNNLSNLDRECDLNGKVWNSSIKVFSSYKIEKNINPSLLLEEIIKNVSINSDAEHDILTRWKKESINLLLANELFTTKNWKEFPIGKAIQLVLLRLEPNRFMTWIEDIPNLPLTVWWSGATLCGLSNGYRRLDVKFRGDNIQKRVLNMYTLNFFSNNNLNSYSDQIRLEPFWKLQDNQIVFTWGENKIWSKPINARGFWFNLDLKNENNLNEAINIAKKYNLPCFEQEFTFPINDVNSFTEKILRSVRNKNLITVTIPGEVECIKKFNSTLFKKCIATEGVESLGFPSSIALQEKSSNEIPGLNYLPNFISKEEEQKLINIIDSNEWLNDLQRRVQHYGWKYDYKARKIDSSMNIGSLPNWASKLAHRMYSEGLVPFLPDQLIINEYVGKQGISKHIDCIPCFEDGIAMISLNESWDIIFSHPKNSKNKISKNLESKSLLIIKGEARKNWLHEIPKRLKEPNGLIRKRRISLTFRKVKL